MEIAFGLLVFCACAGFCLIAYGFGKENKQQKILNYVVVADDGNDE